MSEKEMESTVDCWSWEFVDGRYIALVNDGTHDDVVRFATDGRKVWAEVSEANAILIENAGYLYIALKEVMAYLHGQKVDLAGIALAVRSADCALACAEGRAES